MTPLSVYLLAVQGFAMPAPPSHPTFDREVLCMGTRLALHLEGPGLLPALSESLLTEIRRVEAWGSTWRADTAFAQLNQAGGAPVRLEAEPFEVLRRAQTWSRATNGAFDPVLGALIETWGVRQGGRIPSPTALAAALEASGVHLLQLDGSTCTAQLLRPDAKVEEGGFLKGYALDAAKILATGEGIPSGLLDFGGQLLAWGRPFEIFVAHPKHRHQAVLRLRLHQASLAISGCSERGLHILDPHSGKPCKDWGSVAVVASSAFDADVLSTALYVLGPRHGLAWAETQGYAAAFLPHGARPVLTQAFQKLHPTILSKETP